MLKKLYWNLYADIKRYKMPFFIYKSMHKTLRSLKILNVYTRFAYIYIEAKLAASLRKKSKNTNNHLLLLTWLFPPMISGGVYRPTALVKYGANSNRKISVLAGTFPKNPSEAGIALLKQIPPSVNIKYLPKSYSLISDFFDIDGGLTNAIQTFIELRNFFYYSPPNVILASGPPFHNFVAARLASIYFKCRLVLEYRDEWSECPFGFVTKGFATNKWESWCLAGADMVVFTTDSQLQHQKQCFKKLKNKLCITIPNGWDPDDFPSTRTSIPKKNDKSNLTFAYFGNLGASVTPHEFLNTLTVVIDRSPHLASYLKFKFIGLKTQEAIEQINSFKYKNIIELIDQIPKSEACKMMMSVDGLLLLNPISFNRYLPGKIYDYIASKTPILVFGQGHEVCQIIKNLKNGIIVPPGDPIALDYAIRSITKIKPETNSEIDDWLVTRRRDTLALLTFGWLDKIATNML